MGEASRRGFELFESQNPICEKAVKFIYEDSQYDGKHSLSAFNKLRSTDQVNFTVVWGNTPASVVSPMVERMQAPTLALSMNPDAKGREYVISFGPKIELLVEKIVAQFREWKTKTPAAVSIDIGNALEGVEMVNIDLGGKLIVEKVSATETDFHPIIAKLKARGVDGLLLFAMPSQALTFAKQAAGLEFRPKMIGGDVFADDNFTKQV